MPILPSGLDAWAAHGAKQTNRHVAYSWRMAAGLIGRAGDTIASHVSFL